MVFSFYPIQGKTIQFIKGMKFHKKNHPKPKLPNKTCGRYEAISLLVKDPECLPDLLLNVLILDLPETDLFNRPV